MPVRYEFIDNILADKGLNNPNLNVLVADQHLYKTMLYQHKGDLTATEIGRKFIGNIDQNTAGEKFDSFFKLAMAEGADLIMTPEYSCPIICLSNCLKNNVLPAENHIWVIGCESLSPQEFREFIENNNNVVIISESDAATSHEDKLLDPIVYLFKTTEAASGEVKTVLLFQFKTFPMGGTPIEAANLLFGTRRFIFRNDEDSIYLATINCSESLEIDLVGNLRQFVHHPYLLLHPQMNTSPRTNALKNYRTQFFNSCELDVEKEVISLNWATGSDAAGTKINYGNSAIYTKAQKISTTDNRVTNNDNLGLYYNDWVNAKASILVFDDGEAIFYFENAKVSRRTLPVQNQGRHGPKMLKRFIWDNGWKNLSVSLNQDFAKMCLKIGGDFNVFLSPALQWVSKERLLSLSVGEIDGNKLKSAFPSKLFSIADNEESNRLTVFQDPATQENKRLLLNKYASLVNLISAGNNLIPTDSHMIDMVGKLEISYNENDHFYNINGPSGIPSCIVYLGDSDDAKVSELEATLISLSNDNNLPNRLLILYNHLGVSKKNYKKSAPVVNAPNNSSRIGINKKTND
ncbi:MAG: hypothetical protein WC716_04330 [Chitinophagaceae bacterium]|jgi:hypothetical protein